MNRFRYGWRNLWRNRARTIITLSAAAFSTAVLIASYALMDGLVAHAVTNITNLDVGEVQVHAPGYLADRSIYDSVADAAAVLDATRLHGVDAAPRALGDGLIALGNKSVGAQIWGVEPARERAAFTLAQHVAQGAFLPAGALHAVVLGSRLAQSLDARVGSELVVVVQAADGSLGNDLFTVCGLLESADEALDSAALVQAPDFAELFVSEGRIHEIALNSHGRLTPEALAAIVAAAAPRDDVRTWRQLLPSFSDMLALMDGFIWIFGLVFGLAAGLGVMNTMLMATHERVREFGLIKALGGTPARIVTDVAAEAIVLAALAIVIGTAVGIAGAWYLQHAGIDTSRWAGTFTVAGVAFDPVWRAEITTRIVVIPMLVMLGAAVAPALYPAVVAARLEPVRAMNRV